MIILSYAILKQIMYLYINLIVLHNGLGKISTHKFFVQETWYEGYALCNNAGTHTQNMRENWRLKLCRKCSVLQWTRGFQTFQVIHIGRI